MNSNYPDGYRDPDAGSQECEICGELFMPPEPTHDERHDPNFEYSRICHECREVCDD